MNNLILFLLGLVLFYIPACVSQNNDKQCFSQSLNPSYPCCEGNKIVYTDNYGDWGVEHNEWCGIGNSSSNISEDTCFSVALGYRCCEKCKVVFTDKDGDWGLEHNEWCGIKDSCTSNIEIKDPIQNDTKEVEVKDLVQSDSDFDFSFLKMENGKKNMLYSPLSIKYALQMLLHGAKYNTYAEIEKVIGNTELSKYTNIENILSLANSVFIRDTFYKFVLKEYISILKDKYDAEIIEDEFVSADNINQWIENKTFGIIKDVLTDRAVRDPTICMFLINALAIDMAWVVQFEDDKTFGEPFLLDDGEEIIATTLNHYGKKSDSIAYYIDDDITVLSMDLRKYNESQFEFMAIMPKENLSKYVENISREQINQIDSKLILSSNTERGINVKIPKFKFNYNLSLKKDLMKLGIRDAFSDAMANFSNMVDESSGYKIFVTDALHKADIEFSEDGIKAAAVTIIAMGWGGMGSWIPRTPVNVYIDKPFMFIIRDKYTKDIWFTGTVYEPNLWEDDKDSYPLNNGPIELPNDFDSDEISHF